MAIDKRKTASTIGGYQKWKSRSLFDVMKVAGFDPSKEGDEWALIATDLHCYYEGGLEVAGDFDYRIHEECGKLADSPPDKCLILGDVLTGLVGSFGSSPDFTDGGLEVAAANKGMAAFTNLADTRYILGNHDTPPNESPLGDYMATNLDAFTSLNHAFDLGGVKFVLLSTSHDGALDSGQDVLLASELQNLTEGQECVIGTHQPGGGRVYDHRGYLTILDSIPSGLSNPLWHISGHDHTFGQASCHIVENTTIARQKIGSGGGPWLSFGSDKVAMMAICCRGGKVVGRFAWYGVTQEWHYLPDFDRSNPTEPGRQFDGLANETVLATYNEGAYDRTGRTSPAPAWNTWRDTGTWLAYVYDLTINFPIPQDATKFWYIATAAATTTEMSNDGTSWQEVTHSDFVDNAVIYEIPSDLQAGSNLHVKLTGGGRHISAWGFAR